MKLMHCISGLPRSGSTLLSAILRQNPKYFAAVSDPLCGIVESVNKSFEYNGTYQKILTSSKKIELLETIVQTYYKDIDAEICFNTDRTWTSQLPLLAAFSPETKVICCVRDVPEIINSFEKLRNSNILNPTRFMYGNSSCVYDRAETLMQRDNIIGQSLDALKQAYYSQFSDKLIFVEFKSLTSNPKETMKKLYHALNLEEFDHDFDNLYFDESTEDPYKPKNIHFIPNRIIPYSEELSIPPDLHRKLSGLEFWRK